MNGNTFHVDVLDYQKMLVHVFIDKIYLYDDHFVIYLKGADKRFSISDHEAGIVEEYLTDAGSDIKGCSPPYKRKDVHWASFSFMR